MASDPGQSGSIGEGADKDNVPEPPALRLLRVLVTVLTSVMIIGMIVMVALFWARFSGKAAPVTPETLALPEDVRPQAVTFGDGWVAVVSQDGRILIFDARNGDLVQEIAVTVP